MGGVSWSFLQGIFMENEEWKQAMNDALSLTKRQGRES